MLEELLSVATILSVVKTDGGFLVVGSVMELDENDEYEKSYKMHMSASEDEIVRHVRHYMRQNLEAESESLDE